MKADLSSSEIYPVLELDKHLKFNPWEETTEQFQKSLFLLYKCKARTYCFSPKAGHRENNKNTQYFEQPSSIIFLY